MNLEQRTVERTIATAGGLLAEAGSVLYWCEYQYYQIVSRLRCVAYGCIQRRRDGCSLIRDPPLPPKAQANAMQASECAMAMLSECGKYDVGKGEEAVSLRLHCGMGRCVATRVLKRCCAWDVATSVYCVDSFLF